MSLRAYTAVIERCSETGLLVGYVPGFPGAHSQGETPDELHQNLADVIGMLLEDGEPQLESDRRHLRGPGGLTMAKLPVLKPQEVVSRLNAPGYVEARQRGAHKQFRHPDGRATTVPFHKGRDISPVLLRKVARDIGMPAEDFVAAG
jgi:predicted RNA binding protein YcfA (HicA-like mRNA interferase family)/predicted RNase H-like HicB family nuclease